MDTANRHLVAFSLCFAIVNQIVRCSGGDTNLTYFNNNGHKLLVVFGDSHYDPGNNQYISGGSKFPFPYGMSLKNNHSTGRISDGLLVPDFIASFANLSLSAAILEPGAEFKYGANFASAGGRVLPEKNTRPNMNLPVQMDKFKQLVTSMVRKVGEIETKRVLMSSVHMISIGINDYFSFKGERYPEYNGSCVPRFMNHSYLHNQAISTALSQMARQLPSFNYSLLDYYHALPPRIFDPKKYGFKVGQAACCGSGLYNGEPTCGGGKSGKEPYNLCRDPSDYVLFDGGHHTQKTNQELATGILVPHNSLGLIRLNNYLNSHNFSHLYGLGKLIESK